MSEDGQRVQGVTDGAGTSPGFRTDDGEIAPAVYASEPEPADEEDPAAASEKKASRRRDLIVRLGTSAVLIPFILWTVAQGGLFYLAVVLAIGLAAQHEFYGLIVDKGAKPIRSGGIGFWCRRNHGRLLRERISGDAVDDGVASRFDGCAAWQE